MDVKHARVERYTPREKNGITLVALVVTIIILLILTGVSINMVLGDEGIFSKTQIAADKYKQTQNEEEAIINQMQNYMNYDYEIGLLEGDRNANLKSCTINISNTGVISVSGVSNLKAFIIYKDNKFIDITKEKTYNLFSELKYPSLNGKFLILEESYDIYIIAADEDGSLYKSNIVEINPQRKDYLYDNDTNGDLIDSGFVACNYTPSGWGGTHRNPTMNGNQIVSPGIQGTIYYDNTIDLTNYDFVVIEVTCEQGGKWGGYWCPPCFCVTPEIKAWYEATQYSSPEVSKGFNGFTLIDVSELEGEYYLAFIMNLDNEIHVKRVMLYK